MDRHAAIQQKILSTFAISLIVASIGAILGQFVPDFLFLPLAIFELVILIVALFFRKNKGKIGYPFLYFFTFLTGVTTFPVLAHYTSKLGAALVGGAFLTTAIVFAVLALYGTVTKKDLSFLGGILFSGLIALIILSILNIFFPLGSAALWGITILGIMIFSGYVIYDFNRIKRLSLTEEDVPLMALSIYLDFLNLFLKILQLFGLFSSKD
ncbi:Bax inhibitor-1 family protein [Paenibacillus polymyxa]|uniref:Membrane protein n=1 Tax=Paenibacillus polymyxa (strain SC2) TaxID=886882 RepID=E3EK09_PAEPS|nr:Bax inhibitor-1/YccA family protein [Paenibacillus polymyxa]ADO59718.1 membrane protein [Paenibacillus polymyxa SC2]WPQ59465.1 Bax inhibitor-1/YccA family protein [Paenibacillus polymyxa]